MQTVLVRLFQLSTLFSATRAGPSQHAAAREASTTLLPNEDAFYTPPPGYASAAPGTVFRIRSSATLPNALAAYNILYRTTDADDKPNWAVTTLFIPNTSSSSHTPSPMLTYLIPYNSANLDDSPSYSIYTLYSNPLSFAVAGIPPFAQAISDSLGLGWYVNMPDYEGSRSPTACGAGRQSGRATLDSVRAVFAADLGPANDTRHAMWGYSAGAQAGDFAAELQPLYAPELSFAGAALGGLAPNLTNTADAITGTTWAGLMPAGIIGVSAQYPEAYNHMVSKLKPATRDYFLRSRNLDIIQSFASFAGQNIYDYFTNGRSVFFEEGPLKDALGANGYMGLQGVPRMPVFAYKPVHDQFTPVEDTDMLIEGYCAKGANILYQRNSVGGHLSEIVNGHQRALDWLGDVFAGTYHQTAGCKVENVTVEISQSPT